MGGIQRFAAKLRTMCTTPAGPTSRRGEGSNPAQAGAYSAAPQEPPPQRAHSRLGGAPPHGTAVEGGGGGARVLKPSSGEPALLPAQARPRSAQQAAPEAASAAPVSSGVSNRALGAHEPRHARSASLDAATPAGAARGRPLGAHAPSRVPMGASSPGAGSEEGSSLDDLFSAIEGLHESSLRIAAPQASAAASSSRLSTSSLTPGVVSARWDPAGPPRELPHAPAPEHADHGLPAASGSEISPQWDPATPWQAVASPPAQPPQDGSSAFHGHAEGMQDEAGQLSATGHSPIDSSGSSSRRHDAARVSGVEGTPGASLCSSMEGPLPAGLPEEAPTGGAPTEQLAGPGQGASTLGFAASGTIGLRASSSSTVAAADGWAPAAPPCMEPGPPPCRPP